MSNEKAIANLHAFIKEQFEKQNESLERHSEFLKKHEQKLDFVEKTLNRFMAIGQQENCDQLEKQLNQANPVDCYGDEPSTSSALSSSVLDTDEDCSLSDVLQKEHKKLVDRLHISSIQDQLLEKSVLSPSDHENIQKIKQNRKDQIRLLLVRLRRYGPTSICKFFSVLKQNDQELFNSLHVEDTKLSDLKEHLCFKCLIIKYVDIRDVIDELYSKKLVSLKTMEMLIECSPVTTWKSVFSDLGKGDLETDYVASLKDAIPDRYIELKRKVDTLPESLISTQCCCAHNSGAIIHPQSGDMFNETQTQVVTLENDNIQDHSIHPKTSMDLPQLSTSFEHVDDTSLIQVPKSPRPPNHSRTKASSGSLRRHRFPKYQSNHSLTDMDFVEDEYDRNSTECPDSTPLRLSRAPIHRHTHPSGELRHLRSGTSRTKTRTSYLPKINDSKVEKLEKNERERFV